MHLPDWYYIATDTAEYFFRRLGCRLLGHRWEAQYESLGEQTCFNGYWCRRCHTETREVE